MINAVMRVLDSDGDIETQIYPTEDPYVWTTAAEEFPEQIFMLLEFTPA